MPRKKSDDYEEDSFLDEEIGELDDDFDDLDDHESDDHESDEADEHEFEEVVDDESKDEEVEEKPRRGRKKSTRKPAKASKEEAEPDTETDSEAEAEPAAEAEPEPEPEVEEEIDYPPDDKKAVAALQKLRVRLDVSEKGNVWRAIFNDAAKDQALLLLAGLPALKELWVLGSKVTPDAAKAFKEEHPKMKVYS